MKVLSDLIYLITIKETMQKCYLSAGGTTGSVMMDDLADRVANLAAFHIPPNGKKITKIVNMSSTLKPNCDGIINKRGCYDLVSDSR